ncbi:MgtC/SapB family protein [Miniphocaeibacter massiliensis]|uniref:MgtC/SapB family protein n=1 Tax=Miniphocaeibacter massiliensis TaxID=2041841 RepID=UPI000C1C0199|nr:MgtC/SapB family protein [Miniphocaeibacter massiliensis]
MGDFIDFVYNSDLIYIIRLIIAIICGFIIGMERETKNKDAGTRTHGVVALGSCLCMILSEYGFQEYNSVDPTRIAAQVVSGIGFIGAGIIFVRRDNNISGLTTAAGVWATAIIAMTIGTGMILLGIAGTLLVVILQWSLGKLKYKFNFSNEERVHLTTTNKLFNLENLIQYLEKLNIHIVYLESEKINMSETDIEVLITYPENFDKWSMYDKLKEIDGIKNIRM